MSKVDRWVIGICIFVIVRAVTIGDTAYWVGFMLICWFLGSWFDEIARKKGGDDE